jgi:hypothetical protein
MKEITTTNFEDFNLRDLCELLNAWREQGLPDDFDNDGVHPMQNNNSGNLFLTNSEYQVAMINGATLESFYTCGNCGCEGFAEDCQLNDDGCNECCPVEEEEEEQQEEEEA